MHATRTRRRLSSGHTRSKYEDRPSAMRVMQHIGIRSCVVRTWDGAEVILPNAMLIADPVTNWTLSSRRRRLTLSLGVAYGTDPPWSSSCCAGWPRHTTGYSHRRNRCSGTAAVVHRFRGQRVELRDAGVDRSCRLGRAPERALPRYIQGAFRRRHPDPVPTARRAHRQRGAVARAGRGRWRRERQAMSSHVWKFATWRRKGSGVIPAVRLQAAGHLSLGMEAAKTWATARATLGRPGRALRLQGTVQHHPRLLRPPVRRQAEGN
jgi:hypothetical protein